jgi:hypothetical protein
MNTVNLPNEVNGYYKIMSVTTNKNMGAVPILISVLSLSLLLPEELKTA